MDSSEDVTIVKGKTCCRIPLGGLALPNGASRALLSFRRMVESAVAEVSGGINAWQAKRIRSACIALAEAKRAQLMLAKGGLTTEEEASWSDRLMRNEEKGDVILRSLGLDGAPGGPAEEGTAAIYRALAAAHGQNGGTVTTTRAPEAPNAAAGHLDAVNGMAGDHGDGPAPNPGESSQDSNPGSAAR